MRCYTIRCHGFTLGLGLFGRELGRLRGLRGRFLLFVAEKGGTIDDVLRSGRVPRVYIYISCAY